MKNKDVAIWDEAQHERDSSGESRAGPLPAQCTG